MSSNVGSSSNLASVIPAVSMSGSLPRNSSSSDDGGGGGHREGPGVGRQNTMVDGAAFGEQQQSEERAEGKGSDGKGKGKEESQQSNMSNMSDGMSSISKPQESSASASASAAHGSSSGLMQGSSSGDETISYSAERIIGNGSFGVVFQATVVETGSVVAIKKVLQDKRFKNRELQIMRQLVKNPHGNIVGLKHCFYSQGDKQDELYLNLVLEYVPETVYSISRHHQKSKIPLPTLYVKLYMYQLSRALSHIHSMGICHRDIKPQNLLLNPENHQLKLCDFGSAKALVKGEPNVSYICSRYYRAPELIFGSTDYSTAIDIWSQGCVGAELLLGQPLFPGDSGVDQLVEIIKVLGTPTRDEISAMNSNYTEFKFPQIKACQWKKVFRSKTPEDAISFISGMLAYAPTSRIQPLPGCAHAFFDELRDETCRLPSGKVLPPLFDFTNHERTMVPGLIDRLTPDWFARGNGQPEPAAAGDRRAAEEVQKGESIDGKGNEKHSGGGDGMDQGEGMDGIKGKDAGKGGNG